jgi:two-component system cell cycle sensor histidine kinase/response regulator CckA
MSASGSALRVLVVDDDAIVGQTIAAMLTGRGFAVADARKPSDALRLAQEASEPFDLLVTDVILPEMTGLSLARQLADRWPSLRVVYTSGHASSAIVSSEGAVGGACFLNKPFLSSQLLQAAEQALA